MISWNAKVGSIARTGLALVVLLAAGPGRAQAPGQGPVLGEGAAQIDAPIPGRSITPGQDSFLYPSPAVPGVGRSLVPRPLGPLPPLAPLRPLRRTPPTGSLSTGTAYPGSAGGPPSPLEAGRVLRPWVDRPGRGYFYAIVLSPQGMAYYWIWWPSIQEYYYLFDPAGARYLGAYDRAARDYRPLDAVARRWGKAIAPPLPVPSGPPAALASRGSGAPIQQQPGHPAVSRQPPAQAEPRATEERRIPLGSATGPRNP
jgi:hypothetical protein